MTEIEIKGALSDRGLTDALVRLDYAGESYRISVGREHNSRPVSFATRVDNNPTTGELDAIAHAFKQWWDEEQQG